MSAMASNIANWNICRNIARDRHIGYDRYYPIRALRDHGALAPANRGMGREQNLIDYLIRIRFYASSFLSLQTREAVYEPYPLAIQHDYVSMAHATSPDGQYQ